MYDRSIDGQALQFEPSGGLIQATLVMRDRQTDSWWGMMSSSAIGGPLAGTPLTELPVSEKTTWGAWRKKHPDSLVLSVDGVEHEERNPYADYFTSDRTFRGLTVDDDRLSPKDPIYAFQLGEHAFAVPFRAVEGGLVTDLGPGLGYAFFYRDPGEAVFASTVALRVPEDLVRNGEVVVDGHRVASRADAEALTAREGVARLDGFDTYWFGWVAAHPETAVLE